MLYQQLGDTTNAIALYEKFIAAWEDGDAFVQPLVNRARAVVAALRNEAAPPER